MENCVFLFALIKIMLNVHKIEQNTVFVCYYLERQGELYASGIRLFNDVDDVFNMFNYHLYKN